MISQNQREWPATWDACEGKKKAFDVSFEQLQIRGFPAGVDGKQRCLSRLPEVPLKDRRSSLWLWTVLGNWNRARLKTCVCPRLPERSTWITCSIGGLISIVTPARHWARLTAIETHSLAVTEHLFKCTLNLPYGSRKISMQKPFRAQYF